MLNREPSNCVNDRVSEDLKHTPPVVNSAAVVVSNDVELTSTHESSDNYDKPVVKLDQEGKYDSVQTEPEVKHNEDNESVAEAPSSGSTCLFTNFRLA
jgi:glutaminase